MQIYLVVNKKLNIFESNLILMYSDSIDSPNFDDVKTRRAEPQPLFFDFRYLLLVIKLVN